MIDPPNYEGWNEGSKEMNPWERLTEEDVKNIKSLGSGFFIRFDDRDHEILNYLAKARGQNKTQILKRMLREEEAREATALNNSVSLFIAARLSEISSDRNADLSEGIGENLDD